MYFSSGTFSTRNSFLLPALRYVFGSLSGQDDDARNERSRRNAVRCASISQRRTFEPVRKRAPFTARAYLTWPRSFHLRKKYPDRLADARRQSRSKVRHRFRRCVSRHVTSSDQPRRNDESVLQLFLFASRGIST